MKWIKISDRMPEEYVHVLLHDANEKICVGYCTGNDEFSHHPMGDFATGALLFDVTHWMPLPKVPCDIAEKLEEPCNFCGTPNSEYPLRKCARTPICTNYEAPCDKK